MPASVVRPESRVILMEKTTRWLQAFAADCRCRIVSLLGHEFQGFDCTTGERERGLFFVFFLFCYFVIICFLAFRIRLVFVLCAFLSGLQ